MRTPRHREVKEFAASHTFINGRTGISEPGCLITMQCCFSVYRSAFVPQGEPGNECVVNELGSHSL